MASVFSEMTPAHQEFIQKQQLFFVATAPLSADGHVNLSPKGLDTFCILSPTQVAYLDLTGSGNETSAHLVENGRITLMFCSFDRQPLILRLYGGGMTVLPDSTQWTDVAPYFELIPGVRQIIVVDVHRVQTSCGFGVPMYDYQGQRPTLPTWAQKKGSTAVAQYQIEKGSTSIDGLITPIGQANTQANAASS
ncbi:pyridoxamine 5'-phosphate oxidase family protein [Leptolyngbya cf. ectocarpi LEGE 11479]|uniref:Pyridoxamine 5'-phosphate oxidase family protein n=1 Tax=Leptolyngbya cf. ectocarpi LEGE 11479 TaxID=1828722 RepID=A0A929FBJ7_LEPEC|nr:pyridoxamine 5'-phosphate oxidase family protein [Leptolyngbya ectocarpi]MBE9069054.1 pyridoxamine 5'-phosphate oxidase family protein [Leptolyngbya cf. ectocarpi LEGE 11479]